MQHITAMFKPFTTPKKSTSFLPVFPVRTYRYVTTKAARVSKALEAAYGQKYAGLQKNLTLIIYFLKTARNSSSKDSNMSYATFPRSGTMQNGTVGALKTSGTRITVLGSTLLPTPCAGDGVNLAYSNHRALLDYRRSGRQRRIIYDCWLAGMTDSEILNLYREVMSFPTSTAKLKPSATPSCPLWPNTSSDAF